VNTPVRTALVLFLALSIAGCQLFEPRPDETDFEEPEQVDLDTPDLDPPRLSSAIDLLQDGEIEAAREELKRLLNEQPANAVTARLLEQIDQPPETILGEEFVEITVQPGDTLSGLAAAYTGDGLLFVALARLNGIQRPRLLQPETSLLVPSPAEAEELGTEPNTKQVAIAKIDAGEVPEGLELLLSMARAGGLSDNGRHKLVETGLALSTEALNQGHPDSAASYLEQIDPWVEGTDLESSFKTQQNRIAARQTYESARLTDDPAERHQLLQHALELDPDYAAAAHVLSGLEADLVERYHDQALRAWRRQEVEQAVELWEHVLAIDPDFEPARIYLDRAREILDRLETL
jgi:tetratricopeptide (TPR) repeat protein